MPSELMGHGHHNKICPSPAAVLVIKVSVIVRPIPEGGVGRLHV
jgi:hypothetical protein